ncbi:MAG: hypothetical protein AB1641_25385 [Thermodesulfobacteriota bacterium]
MAGLAGAAQGSYLEELLPALARLKKEVDRDIVVVFENRAVRPDDASVEALARTWRARYQAEGLPVYPNVERAPRGIKHAAAYQRSGGRDGDHPPGLERRADAAIRI